MGELTGQSTVRQRPGSTSIGGAARTPEFSNGSTGSDAPWWSSPVVVAVVLLAGLALRIFAAFRFPFEQDELYTFLESRDLFHTGLAPGIDTRPLYYLIQHPLLGAVPTPLSLRWLPLLFGALGLWATWQIGRRYFGAAGGVVAAILVAVSPWHLYASSMARYYSLVYLCAALVVLWLPGAYESDEPKDYLRLLAVFIVGTLTHPSFVFAMVGLVAGLSLVRNDARFGLRWPSVKAWTYLWGPYAAALVIEFLMVHFFGRRGSIGNLGSRGIAATLRLVPAMVDWMTLPVFIGACVGALLMTFRRSENRRIGVIAIASTIGAMVLLVGASFRTGVYADYGIGILPLLFLCVTALSSELASPIERGRANLVLLALVVGSGAPSIVSFLSDGLRFDYRPAYRAIAAKDPKGVVLGWPEVLRRFYAADLRGYELKPDSTYLNGILQREQHVWAVVSAKRYGIVEDDAGQIAGWLAANCHFENSFTRPRLDYRLYRVDLYQCRAAPTSSTASVGASSPTRGDSK